MEAHSRVLADRPAHPIPIGWGGLVWRTGFREQSNLRSASLFLFALTASIDSVVDLAALAEYSGIASLAVEFPLTLVILQPCFRCARGGIGWHWVLLGTPTR